MKITLLDHLPAECDVLADASTTATFYHTSTWLHSLAKTLSGLTLRCLVAEDGGVFSGYLPFFFVRMGPLQRAWSLPFGTYGGPVAAGNSAVIPMLLDEYRRATNRRDVIETGWVDFHGIAPASAKRGTPGTTQIVDLSQGFDHVWDNLFARDKRKRARKATRDGVTVERCSDASGVDSHYGIYSERVSSFGTQEAFPVSLFEELFTRGGDRVRLFLAWHQGHVVGSHFNFYHKDAVVAWYGMASAAGDNVQAGTLLYTDCIRDACTDGFTSYNLGASLGRQSLIDYKESLGGATYTYDTHIRRTVLGRFGATVRRLRRRG